MPCCVRTHLVQPVETDHRSPENTIISGSWSLSAHAMSDPFATLAPYAKRTDAATAAGAEAAQSGGAAAEVPRSRWRGGEAARRRARGARRDGAGATADGRNADGVRGRVRQRDVRP